MNVHICPDIAFHISKFLQHRDYCLWRLATRLGEQDKLGRVISMRKRQLYCLYGDDGTAAQYFRERGFVPKCTGDKFYAFMKWFRENKLCIYNFHRTNENEFRSYNSVDIEGIVILSDDTYLLYRKLESNMWDFTITRDNRIVWSCKTGLFKSGNITLTASQKYLIRIKEKILYYNMDNGYFIIIATM